MIAEVVAAHGGTLLKSKLEGDATVSVFARAIRRRTRGPGAARAPSRQRTGPPARRRSLRMAMHTGEAFERGGDYFGPALNRAARLRALGGADEVLLSQAVTELVRDHLPAGAALRDLGHRDLRGMARGENVYALSRSADAAASATRDARAGRTAFVPPALPAPLAGSGPFVGRVDELQRLVDLWAAAAAGVAGRGVHRRRARRRQVPVGGRARRHAPTPRGAIVLHGRCDEDLGRRAPPVRRGAPPAGPGAGGRPPGIGARRRRARPGAARAHARCCRPAARPSGPTPTPSGWPCSTRSPACCERRRWQSPVLLVLDDLHWAGKTTLSLLRHVLRETRRGAAPGRRHLPRHRAGPDPPAGRDAGRPPPGRRFLAGSRSAGWHPATSTPTSRPSGSTTAPSAASSPRSPRATRTS